MNSCARCNVRGVEFIECSNKRMDKYGVECPKCGKIIRGYSVENAVDNWNLFQSMRKNNG